MTPPDMHTDSPVHTDSSVHTGSPMHTGSPATPRPPAAPSATPPATPHRGRARTAALQEPLLDLLGVADGEPFVADLHAHTVTSDGADTLEEVLGKSRVRGVTHQAITNHDTTIGLTDAADLAARTGAHIVCGTEVSAYDPATGRHVHVLGLGLSEGSPAVEALCAPTLARRTANTSWQLERLLADGIEVDVDECARHAARSTAFYWQHLMAGLTSEPRGSETFERIYRSLFAKGAPYSRDIAYVDMRDAVRAILDDGGLPVLAHPAQYDSFDAVGVLADAGLAGIEAYHYTSSPADERRILDLADEHSLFVTGGSDYHGTFSLPPHPGYRTICN